MSWQRIDENTYIDDTLVTCAEYQLFIDELRGQRKYYQPDHWTSYQYPDGHAREPILGVRQSDVPAFCGWLMQGMHGEWKYRWPTYYEAEHFPMKHLEQKLLGYWVDEIYRLTWDHNFAWVGPIPLRAREIVFNDRLRDPWLSRSIEHVKNRPLDISLHNASISGHDFVKAFQQIVDRSHATDHSRNFELSSALDLGLAQAYEILKDAPDGGYFGIGSADSGYLPCADILTLQERIMGRSPAFEGIRLVKERK